MKMKYIVISQEKGVFLGAVSGYALFSKTNPMGMYNAYGFDTLDTAQNFVSTNLPTIANTAIYPQIPTSTDYVSCVDIIKHGYGKYTHDMMNYLDMPSESVH